MFILYDCGPVCPNHQSYWSYCLGSGFLVPGMVFLVPVVFFSRNGVFSSRRVRWFLGCFQFPGWGVFSSQIRACCSRNGLLGARGCFLFPEWCFPFPARGDGMAVFVVPVRCFFLLLLASLLFFVRCFLFFLSSFLPLLPCFLLFLFPFVRSCLPPSFSPPALPLIFLRSFPFLLPALASFPSLSFPFRPLPEFPSRTCPSLP